MENFLLIKQGAESKLYKGTYLGKLVLVKERFEKKYRHHDLDTTLTKERIKAESRAILKCKSVGIRTPAIYLSELSRRMICMEYFEHSITAKEFIFKAGDVLIQSLSADVGRVIGNMHAANIVHGDLTTSNMLLRNKLDKDEFFENYNDLELVLIDFGLSHTESSPEDKGVDLYVLERALQSTHSVHNKIFPAILKAYRSVYKNGSKEVLTRYNEVRARGRKRTMVG